MPVATFNGRVCIELALSPPAARDLRSQPWRSAVLRPFPASILMRHAAFEARDGDKRVKGFVYESLPQGMSWQARIDGTAILVKAETRRQAVELAVARRLPADAPGSGFCARVQTLRASDRSR